jgi:drug/metabolite transporter (DMT)-like permease
MSDVEGFQTGLAERPGEEPGRPTRAYLYLAIMVVLGSTTAPAARFAVRDLPAGFLPLVRFGLAGLCLLPVVGRRGGNFWRLLREDFWRLALAGALCVPVNQAFFLNATRLAPTSHVALIYAACPLFVLLLTVATGQETLRIGRLIGVLASVAGVVLIGLESYLKGRGTGQAAFSGDLLLVFAVLSWAGYLTTSKPLVAKHGALPVLAGTFLLGTLLHVPVALTTFSSWPPLLDASPAAWRGLLYLTVVVTLVGLMYQNLAMRQFDASEVATFGNASPVLTVVWGIWLFGEAVTPALVVVGLLTLGGILWAVRPTAVPLDAMEVDVARPEVRLAPASLSGR